MIKEMIGKSRIKLGEPHTISFTCDIESDAIESIIEHCKRKIEYDYNLLIAGTEHQDKLFMFNKEDIVIDKKNNRVNINIRAVKELKSGLKIWEETIHKND